MEACTLGLLNMGVPGKTRFLVGGLIVAGLVSYMGFWEVKA